VLTAFVAPLAITLLRLLTPVLRLMLKILPAWFAFTGAINDVLTELLEVKPLLRPLFLLITIVAGIQRLIGMIPGIEQLIGRTESRVGDVVNGITNLPGRIWSFMMRLPDMISNRLTNLIPGTGDIGDRVGGGLSRLRGFLGGDDGGGAGGTDQPLVNLAISGGLSPFVKQIEQDGSIDLP